MTTNGENEQINEDIEKEVRTKTKLVPQKVKTAKKTKGEEMERWEKKAPFKSCYIFSYLCISNVSRVICTLIKCIQEEVTDNSYYYILKNYTIYFLSILLHHS